jgi:hypothetical protein
MLSIHIDFNILIKKVLPHMGVKCGKLKETIKKGTGFGNGLFT